MSREGRRECRPRCCPRPRRRRGRARACHRCSRTAPCARAVGSAPPRVRRGPRRSARAVRRRAPGVRRPSAVAVWVAGGGSNRRRRRSLRFGARPSTSHSRRGRNRGSARKARRKASERGGRSPLQPIAFWHPGPHWGVFRSMCAAYWAGQTLIQGSGDGGRNAGHWSASTIRWCRCWWPPTRAGRSSGSVSVRTSRASRPHARLHGAPPRAGHRGVPASAVEQLQEYLAGSRKTFDLRLRPLGTEFQRAAWEVLTTIPYGETRSYGQQAAAMDNPRAVRAVGQANGENPIPIVIPCHRVIGADGSLTGFGGGLVAKRWLLEHEAPQLALGIRLGNGRWAGSCAVWVRSGPSLPSSSRSGGRSSRPRAIWARRCA